MKMPRTQAIDMVKHIVLAGLKSRYPGITYSEKSNRDVEQLEYLTEVWIAENCHACLNREDDEWRFFTHADHLLFLIRYGDAS